MDLVSSGVELLAGWAESVIPDGILQSLVVNGIIAESVESSYFCHK